MKILFLVLFFLIMSLSCKQNPRSILSTPPKIDEGATNNNTGSSNTNSGGNNDLNSGYGYYDVNILENGTDIKTVKYRISDTDKLLEAYSNMILNTNKTPKFKLSKNDTETYTFDSNLNLLKDSKISKKFKGVCLVIIYPDATDPGAATTTIKSSLLGNYTIAGIYKEENTATGNSISSRAMTKTDNFQKTGFDELIILRYDITNTTSKAIDTSSGNTANYRADILFNDDKWISVFNYDPDRTFEKQNTNFIFKRATQ